MLPRLFLVFVDASEVPEHLCSEEPQWNLKEQGFELRLTRCCIKIAQLLLSLSGVGLTNGGSCPLGATEWLRQDCYDMWWLKLIGRSQR